MTVQIITRTKKYNKYINEILNRQYNNFVSRTKTNKKQFTHIMCINLC